MQKHTTFSFGPVQFSDVSLNVQCTSFQALFIAQFQIWPENEEMWLTMPDLFFSPSFWSTTASLTACSMVLMVSWCCSISSWALPIVRSLSANSSFRAYHGWVKLRLWIIITYTIALHLQLHYNYKCMNNIICQVPLSQIFLQGLSWMGEIMFMNYNYNYNCITFTIALQLQVHEQYHLRMGAITFVNYNYNGINNIICQVSLCLQDLSGMGAITFVNYNYNCINNIICQVPLS